MIRLMNKYRNSSLENMKQHNICFADVLEFVLTSVMGQDF